MAGKFELLKASNGQFFFRLKAGNGETILMSEQYKARASAENGIESVKKNAPLEERFERKTSKDGKFYFVLKASNGQVIGQSEMYTAAASMENGIESVKKNAPEAPVIDKTAE